MIADCVVRSVAGALSGIALVTLCGCSGGSDPVAAGRAAVPAGVVTQYATIAEEIREKGGETTVGEWRVGYIVESAEAWHQIGGGGHSYRQPADGETHHIEIIPFEASTGRVVPDVPIRLQVMAADGRIVDDRQLSFYYSPEFFHYATNFSIPEPGRYTLRAQLVSPPFPRHGDGNQPPALADGASVEFKDVEINP